ncbi:glycosyltransferase [Desulfoglaeba alkanexedens]|nr:glycosyltransferase [Desulfoglaeba alkanexedens]
MSRSLLTPRPRKIAIFMRSMQGSGGAERAMLNLAHGLSNQGHRVDMVMARRTGHFLDEIHSAIRVVDLKVRSARECLISLPFLGRDAWFWARMALASKPHFVLGALPKLARYLRREKPDVLISAMDYPNAVAIAAKSLAGDGVPVIATVRNTLSAEVANTKRRRIKAQVEVARYFYPRADALVAVSRGVADDLAQVLGRPDKIETIYNPIVSPDLATKAAQPLNHPWFSGDGPPVILAVGGFKPQKDFATLFKAFAIARRERPLRLLVLGEGKLRQDLTALASQLGIAGDLQMPGFVDNPYPYMARSALLVLSSIYEGLPNVVVQALACGCPVVSTDCPSGPAEILDNGRYGTLVPVKDEDSLAVAMLRNLEVAWDKDLLMKRAQDFSVERATRHYLDVIERVCRNA